LVPVPTMMSTSATLSDARIGNPPAPEEFQDPRQAEMWP
jgi:hypothetical protein